MVNISGAPEPVFVPGAVVGCRAFFLDSRAVAVGAAESAAVFARWRFAVAASVVRASAAARPSVAPGPAACEDSRLVVPASVRGAD